MRITIQLSGNLQFTNHYVSDLAHFFIKIYSISSHSLTLCNLDPLSIIQPCFMPLLSSLQSQSIQLSIIQPRFIFLQIPFRRIYSLPITYLSRLAFGFIKIYSNSSHSLTLCNLNLSYSASFILTLCVSQFNSQEIYCYTHSRYLTNTYPTFSNRFY